MASKYLERKNAITGGGSKAATKATLKSVAAKAGQSLAKSNKNTSAMQAAKSAAANRTTKSTLSKSEVSSIASKAARSLRESDKKTTKKQTIKRTKPYL